MAEAKKRGRTTPASVVGEGARYTQINILFKPGQDELPSAERLNAYSAEAQRAIIEAFQREQSERHRWMHHQQANDHDLNMATSRQYFVWRMCGTCFGALAVLLTLLLGGWLVAKGSSGIGVATMISAVAALIGTAIYGQKVNRQTAARSPSDEPQDGKK